MFTNQEAAILGCAIDELILGRGLGAISKKDYELLIFHHLINSRELRVCDNYLLANKLKITEAKVKLLRLESSIRHQPANHKSVLRDIVQRIIDDIHKPSFSDGVISISLENPIDRREFEYAVKLTKNSVEYGINREILKIDVIALFEVILATGGDAEARFKQIVQSHMANVNMEQELLDKSLTLRQRINKLRGEFLNSKVAELLLGAALGFL